MNSKSEISSVATLAKNAKKILFFTGAGISTPSGIPDFRSPNGIWQKFDPNEYCTITAFRKNPEKVWEFFLEAFSIIKSAEPNEAHYAISNIQKILGEEKVFVATQNIDTLHQKANTKNVFEIHGTTSKLHCLWCQYEEVVDEKKHLSEKFFPQCPKCNNPLKPKVILFGEYLPQEVYTATFETSRQCDLLIAVGTSLEVYHASYLFFENRKTTRVLFNYTSISNMNKIQYFVQGNVQYTLPELEKELKKII